MSQQKQYKWKYKLAITIILICIFAGYIYKVITWTPVDSEAQKASNIAIRYIVASQLNKDMNDLNNADFIQITELNLSGREIFDLKQLEKFINLKELSLVNLHYPESDIPTWMKILSKTGIFNIEKRFLIDLKPLEKHINLQKLYLGSSKIKNTETLAKFINLRELDLYGTQVSDLEPIKNLTKLHTLNLNGTQISDLEPISDLTNMETLRLENTQVSDINHLKKLINLQHLSLRNCKNISDEKVEDLQKALPNLKITR